MKILNLVQGTPEWHAHRAKSRNASEASAMLGFSKYKTRSQLLKEKATGIIDDVDAGTQRRFDDGHEAEAAARPNIEATIGEDLYPATAASDDYYLSASFDGITMDESLFWENKLFNKDLAAYIEANNDLPDSHWPQVEQQYMISKANRGLFTLCDRDGNVKLEHWYVSRPERQAQVLAGWNQFDIDLDSYVTSDVKEMPKAEVTIDLPALFVHARGEITTHNMDEFGIALAANLAETRAIVLITDQDFSNAKAAAKKFRDTAKAIAVSKEQMLAQTETIGEAARKMDAWAKDLNATALQLEKDVEREDKAKKEAMVIAGKNAYMEHVAALEARVSPIRLNLATPNFADAIKGKRNYTSMQDAIDTELANAKILSNEYTDKIDANLKHFHIVAWDCKSLFADLQTLVTKPADDFAAVVKMRIQDHAAAEQAKADALRERIRAEEQAKAQADAEAKAQAETAAKAAQEAKLVADDEARKLAEGIAVQVTTDSIEVGTVITGEKEGVVTGVVTGKAVIQTEAEKAVTDTSKRPTDKQIIFAIATQFNVDFHTAAKWIKEIDFSQMRGAA